MQGHYCFDRNLATAITTGNAITVNSDFVVIDLNNFKLNGGSAGVSTNAIGIFSLSHRNITIRNGNIRGFKLAIYFHGTSSGGHVIENNVLDGNTVGGALLIGDTMVVRDNIVANTGGSTQSSYSYGIAVDATEIVSIRDNTVSNTFGNGTATDTGFTEGIWAPSNGSGSVVGGSVVDHNVVRMGAPAPTRNTRGIYAGGVCRDNTTLNATVANSCFASVGANYP